MPRRIAAFISLRRKWLVVGAAAAVAASSASVASLTGTSLPPHRAVAHVESAGGPVGPSSMALRSLPHDVAGTVGAAPFSERPPRAGRIDLTALLAVSAGIPAVAIAAYERAAGILARSDPSCHLGWYDLAGIGRVESDNGMTWGAKARVSPNGTLYPPIYGPLLDGEDGMPAIPTTDGGVLEHDAHWARAVGPMQFLPATWLEYAQDGNGDGVKNPQNFYDAALTAGAFLCANGGDLATKGGLKAAVYAYNHSASYVSLVESWVRFYGRAGVAAVAAAGSGLLPIGQASAGGGGTHSSGPAGGGGRTSLTPAAVLAAAAHRSQAAGSYAFTFRLSWGSATVTGEGAIDTAASAGTVTLRLPDGGYLSVRCVAGATDVALPADLATSVGAEGTWVRDDAELTRRLPAQLDAGISAISHDLVWIVGQLEGAAAPDTVLGHPVIAGMHGVLYGAEVGLAAAGTALHTRSLAGLAAQLASPAFAAQAFVGSDGLVHQLDLVLPALAGAKGPVSIEVSIDGYGDPVVIQPPTVSGLSTPTTTTTTTTTTSTTTTTVPTTTTTVPTTTSTTTTTTTTVPPSTVPPSSSAPSTTLGST